MSIPSPVRKSLEKLPRRSAPWLIGSTTKPDGSCGCYVLDRDADARAAVDLPAAPDGAAWGKLLVAAMQRPLPLHEPGLPRRLICDDRELAAVLAPIVSPLRIAVEVAASPHLAAAKASVAESTAPCLKTLPDALRSFFADAASLAEIAPWDWFHEQPEFAIATADPDAPPAVAVLMGGLGSSFGFALLRNEADLREDMETAVPRVRRVPHTVLELESAMRAPSAMRTRSAERGYAIYAADWYPLALRVTEDARGGWDATAIPGLAHAATAILRWCQLAKEGRPFAKEAGAAVLRNRLSFAGVEDNLLEGDDADAAADEDLLVPCNPVWEITGPSQPPTLRLPVPRDCLEALNDALSQSREIEVNWGPEDEYGILDFAKVDVDGEGAPEAPDPLIGVEFTTLPDAAWLRAAALAADCAYVVLVDGEASGELARSQAEEEAASIFVEFFDLNAVRRKLGVPEVSYGDEDVAIADAAWSTEHGQAALQITVTKGNVAAAVAALQKLDQLDLVGEVHDCPECGHAFLSLGSFDAAGALDARIVAPNLGLPDSAWLDLARAQGVHLEVALNGEAGADQGFARIELPLGAIAEVRIR